MTKTLILVRHSKTENRTSSQDDYYRALTEQGKRDSASMASFLAVKGIIPDYIIASSATRAFDTATIFADVFKIGQKCFTCTRQLYYCSAKTILDQIYELNEDINCLMIVAHNPGISDLSRGLSSGRTFFLDNTQVSVFSFDIEQWYQIDDQKPSKFDSYSMKEIS